MPSLYPYDGGDGGGGLGDGGGGLGDGGDGDGETVTGSLRAAGIVAKMLASTKTKTFACCRVMVSCTCKINNVPFSSAHAEITFST